MSFLDTIKDRLRGVDDYYEDDYYDEDYESDGYEQDDRRSRDTGGSGRLLGTRGEAHRVAVTLGIKEGAI